MAIATVTETTAMDMVDAVIMITAGIGITGITIMANTDMGTAMAMDTAITATVAFRSISLASDMCLSAGDDTEWAASLQEPRQ
jgi:hypothetical protein